MSDYLVFNIKSTCGLRKLVSSQPTRFLFVCPDYYFSWICRMRWSGGGAHSLTLTDFLSAVCVVLCLIYINTRRKHNRGQHQHYYCRFLQDDLSKICLFFPSLSVLAAFCPVFHLQTCLCLFTSSGSSVKESRLRPPPDENTATKKNNKQCFC